MAASWFWDRIAKRYAKSPVADEQAYRKKLEVTQTYLRPDMNVLEFGCGTGTTAIAHAPFVNSITAIDISKNMLQIARNKAEAAHIRNISFEQSGIEEFKGNGKSFDVIMGHSILHLLKDRDVVVSKIHELLRPGGIFVSSTACLDSGMRFFRFVLPIGHFFGLLPQVRFFSKGDLEETIVAGGFEIELLEQPGDDRVVFIVARKPG